MNKSFRVECHPVESSPDQSWGPPEKWLGQWSQFSRNRCAESYCQSTSPYTSVFISIISLFLGHLMPVLSVQWICCFEKTCSSPPAYILPPFPLGNLGRGRGGGGGGILHSLPHEELLEDRVHLATNLLRDSINNGDERENKDKAVPSARQVLIMFNVLLLISFVIWFRFLL